jgi:L-lactate dehydrogenase complex protein LldF
VCEAVADERVVRAVHLATWHKVETRAESMRQLRDPEAIRELAAQIKQHTLENLPRYLEQFVAQVERSGGQVHFAADADAARRIICDIAAAHGAKLAVKAKSMTSEEIHLNDALEAIGVRTVETDLGEFIVQIDHDRPSHIVTPIIHKDRRQIAQAMTRETGCAYTEDAEELTAVARRYLRDIFRRCELGITGVNFGVAESGTLCVCTNEGNGRMSSTRPRVHVALLGIEKLVPRLRDLPVFLKLLARSSTGQPLTVYTTLITGPKRADDPDGPEELHVVLLDNGRSELLAGEFAKVLRCIRCGACLNACPVYRNLGGHAYGSVYPGPIGSLVTPLLRGLDEHAELPRASSLCGACQVVCPVKVDIPGLLVRLRARTRRTQPLLKRVAMRAWKWMMKSPTRYRWAQWWLPRLLPDCRDGWSRGGPGPLGAWTHSRDLPIPPKHSFRRLWRERLSDER